MVSKRDRGDRPWWFVEVQHMLGQTAAIEYEHRRRRLYRGEVMTLVKESRRMAADLLRARRKLPAQGIIAQYHWGKLRY